MLAVPVQSVEPASETGASERAEGKLGERRHPQRPLGSHDFRSLGRSQITYLLARSTLQRSSVYYPVQASESVKGAKSRRFGVTNGLV